MAKQTIYANEIKSLKSVISVLSGSDNFAIENPWFPIPGAKPCDPKTFLNVIPDKKGGLFLNAPRLLHKTASGPFSWNFVIGWTQIVSNQKLKKEYRINAPVAQEELKRKQKLMVSPVKRELEPDDAALLLFSWQLSIVQDIILIAKILNINMAKYAGMNNDAFFPAFVADINQKLKEKKAQKLLELDPGYVETWDNAPILSQNKRKEPIYIYDVNEPHIPAFMPIMASFYESITSIKGKQTFEPKFIERVWANPNCFSIPNIRLKCFIPSDGESPAQQVMDCRLTFISLVPPTDKEFNEKFPESLCTTWQQSKVKKVKITKNDLPMLWGNTVYNPASDKHESARWSGCMFIQPQLSYSFHEKGSPVIEWRTDTIALTRIVAAVQDEVDDACDFMDDEQPAQMMKKEDSGDGAEFMTNEDEQDPDAL